MRTLNGQSATAGLALAVLLAFVPAPAAAQEESAPATVTLTASPSSRFRENTGKVRITATLDRPAIQGMIVTLTPSGTATKGADYTLEIDPFIVLIEQGDTSAFSTLTIVNDAVDENNETIILTPMVTTPPSSGITGAALELTIVDNDDPGPTDALLLELSETSDPRVVAYRASGSVTLTQDVSATTSSIGRIPVDGLWFHGFDNDLGDVLQSLFIGIYQRPIE